MSYTTTEIVSHLRHFWEKATGLDYGHEHEIMRAAADDLERKDAEIAELRAENTNLRAAMDSIRSIVLASRTLEQLGEKK